MNPAGEATHELSSAQGLGRVLRFFSVVTLGMTVPQAIAVWTEPHVGGVSLLSWLTYLVSACLWLVYGVMKRNKTIYLPCIGWILADAAVVLGILIHR